MINVCMECGYEWGQETKTCPKCNSANFDTQEIEEGEDDE